MKLSTKLRTVLVAMALAAAVPTAAHAQHAAADVLFDAGYKLKQAGRYEEAAAKFYESNEIDPAPGTLLNLAECYVQLGKTASAWSAFRGAAALAANRGQDERVRFAEKQVSLLEKRLSTITVDVPEEHRTDGLVITRDGKPISPELWGQALPIDPGTSKFEATAPGRQPWSLEVTVRGDAASRTVLIPMLTEEESPTPSPAAPKAPPTVQLQAPPAGTPGKPPDRGAEPDSSRALPAWVGYGALGLGGALFAAGAVTYGIGRSTVADANCPEGVCVVGTGDPDEYDKGRSQEKIGVAVGGVGLAVAALGVVFVVTRPSQKEPAVAFGAAPTLGGAAVTARGSF